MNFFLFQPKIVQCKGVKYNLKEQPSENINYSRRSRYVRDDILPSSDGKDPNISLSPFLQYWLHQQKLFRIAFEGIVEGLQSKRTYQ